MPTNRTSPQITMEKRRWTFGLERRPLMISPSRAGRRYDLGSFYVVRGIERRDIGSEVLEMLLVQAKNHQDERKFLQESRATRVFELPGKPVRPGLTGRNSIIVAGGWRGVAQGGIAKRAVTGCCHPECG
jgi:hypothetical protein